LRETAIEARCELTKNDSWKSARSGQWRSNAFLFGGKQEMGIKDFDVRWWLDQSAHKRTYADQTTPRDAKRGRPHSFEDDLAGHLIA